MKTIQELYSEVLKSEELKKAFFEAVQGKTVEDFLKKNGCEASIEDVAAFLKEQQTKTGELSDGDLTDVAGGRLEAQTWQNDLLAGISALSDTMNG